MMRPYPTQGKLDLWEMISNYPLSRARLVIENTFVIMVFKIFLRPIIARVDNFITKFITKATIGRHIRQSNSNGYFAYCPPDFVDQENGGVKIPGDWRRKVDDVQGVIQINK